MFMYMHTGCLIHPFLHSELFQVNPRGLKGFFELKATIPKGSKVAVGGSGYNWFSSGEVGGRGRLDALAAVTHAAVGTCIETVHAHAHPLCQVELGGNGQPGSTPATVRIAEIRSLQVRCPFTSPQFLSPNSYLQCRRDSLFSAAFLRGRDALELPTWVAFLARKVPLS